jgi:hypothetical protein
MGRLPPFRHTCATVLFRGGFNAKQVHMWLGHHSPAFTLATYVHLLPDDLPESPFETHGDEATEPVAGDHPTTPPATIADAASG